jgi:putative endonuclease
VYILHSEKLDRFSLGATSIAPQERLRRHNQRYYSHKFTAKGIPWTIFLTISCESMKQALDIERHIKSMKSKVYIRNLDKYPEMIEKLLARY